MTAVTTPSAAGHQAPEPTGASAASTARTGRTVLARSRHPGRRHAPWPRRAVVAALLLGASVVFLAPLVWLLSASLKPRPEVFNHRLLPDPVAWQNYVDVFEAVPLALWTLNSVVVGLAAAAAMTVSSALVAFGFAYFRFRGRDALFTVVLATMMLPGVVALIPTFIIWQRLGLVGTQVPLWAGNLFASAFSVFLLRQFFLGIPRELFEAATVDGASSWRLFRSIAVPLSWPALTIVFVLELKASWTDLIRPLIYLQDTALFTLPLGLKVVLDQFGKGGEAEWQLVLAASVIATIPMVLVFFVGQRFFVEGVATAGRKG
jgi:multiple sugar transport system permease protein